VQRRKEKEGFHNTFEEKENSQEVTFKMAAQKPE
jgi:hypothetical protein